MQANTGWYAEFVCDVTIRTAGVSARKCLTHAASTSQFLRPTV
jgi:hypothetical protein